MYGFVLGLKKSINLQFFLINLQFLQFFLFFFKVKSRNNYVLYLVLRSFCSTQYIFCFISLNDFTAVTSFQSLFFREKLMLFIKLSVLFFLWRVIIFRIRMSASIETTHVFSFQGDCWICMELMATSLDKFYKFVYQHLDSSIPEAILSKITYAVSLFCCAIRFI